MKFGAETKGSYYIFNILFFGWLYVEIRAIEWYTSFKIEMKF